MRHMNLKERAKQLKTDIPAVFLLLKRRETPFDAKIVAAIAVAYALSPIDFIPDFIPLIGLLDDVILLEALIALVIKLIPAEVFAQCKREAYIHAPIEDYHYLMNGFVPSAFYKRKV